MSIKNAKEIPKVFYGLHFMPGVAEYSEGGKDPYRIFLNQDTINKMNPSFAGRPVYVKHVDEVDLEKIQEADGYVVESFYNAVDGKTWCKFIVVSDKGHNAIRNGWKLSNAYVPKGFAGGGLWNGVQYTKEVTQGEFEHLALVNNPRYDESIILDPEQFKQYCEEKRLALTRVANSKKGESKVFKLFKKEKIENSSEYDTLVVELPKSKKSFTFAEIVDQFDTIQNMQGYASPDHMVKAGDEEMSVNELATKYCAMKKNEEEAKVKKNAEEEEEKKKKENMSDEEKAAEAKKNAEEEEKKKKENEAKVAAQAGAGENGKSVEQKQAEELAAEAKKANDLATEATKKAEAAQKIANAHFEALKNAPQTAIKTPVRVDLDSADRGKKRYGSN